MKKYVAFLGSIIAITLFIHSCSNYQELDSIGAFPLSIRAVDLSFLPELRASGVCFKTDEGYNEDVLEIFRKAGCNTVRLRLWHNPESVHSSLKEVAEFAKEIRGEGMKIWITVHYSDQWADPGQQYKPAAWASAELSILADSVYTYTKKVVQQLNPDYIQIGNELNNGFLWPDGHITNQESFIMLLSKGVRAVREASSAKTLIHFAGTDGATAFFTALKNSNMDYDITALSYYSRWHTRSLSELDNTINQLIGLTGKELVIAETAYPFTLSWNDWTTNLVGLPEHLIDGFPASEDGQYAFLLELRKMIAKRKKGSGFCYWAPEWVAYKGAEATDGSPWENMALFSFENKALKGVKVFKK